MTHSNSSGKQYILLILYPWAIKFTKSQLHSVSLYLIGGNLAYLDKRVKIVAISNENRDKIQEFIERRDIDLEFLKLNGDLNYFGAYSLPTTIVFDKEGKESFRIASGIDFASQNFVEKILNLEKL